MKKLVSLLFVAACFANAPVQAAESDAEKTAEENQKLIETFVRSNVYAQPKVLAKDVIGKVFEGDFYETKVKISYTPGSSSSSTESGINVHDGEVTKVAECCSNHQEFPTLLSLVKKDFLLKDEKAAKQFEAALDLLYPPREKDRKEVKHMQEGEQWIFIRGTFFDDAKAFAVTTDPDGTVTNIEFKLPYPESD